MLETEQDAESQTDPWRLEVQRDVNRSTLAKIIGAVWMFCAYLLVIIAFPLSLLSVLKIINVYERVVVYRLGLYKGIKGPGIILILPIVDYFEKVDMRTFTFDVPSQEILTKDACTITVDAVIYYKVDNPLRAVQNIIDYRESSWALAATTLRAVLGRNVLADILSEREALATLLQSILDEATDIWGMKIENVEIKDVRLPPQLQRAMAAEAEATRDARAKIINAEGEKRAALNLREASDVIASSPVALKLRYLQTLNTIAAEKKSTILFPVPMKM